MSGNLQAPDPAGAIGRLLARVTRLERRLGEAAARTGPDEVPFSYSGLLAAVESPPWVCRRGRTTVAEFVLSLLVPGSTEVTVAVRVNGITVATPTIPAGSTVRAAPAGVALAVNDKVTMLPTDLGTDAESLTVQMVLRYPT